MYTRTHLTPRKTPIALAVSLALGSIPVAMAGPTGGVVTGGQGTISNPSSSTTVINQSSNQLNINWNTFNVNSGESVLFHQPTSSSVAFNNILDQNPSQIFGLVQGNGQVVLINPNGFLIGRTGQLNVNSLVLSSLQAIDFNAADGRYRFSSLTNPGAIVNEGTITAGRGGSVTLLGGQVTNSGNIVADYGTVNLAAGRTATLDLAGDGLLRLEVGSDLVSNSGGAVSAVENSGSITANGGQVLLTAAAVQGVFTNLINNTGVVRANRINNAGGVIQLLGSEGNVVSSGTLDASAGDARSSGGSVTLVGERVGLFGNAVVNVSGATGGGMAYIGGGDHGENPDVPDAQETLVSSGTTIDADAGTTGNGGHVVVWSNDFTGYAGSISARGGSVSGNGGYAEVSGKSDLQFTGSADLTAPYGAWGTLLLDPAVLDIVAASDITNGNTGIPSDATSSGGVYTWDYSGTFNGGTVADTAIVSMLNQANVVLKASTQATLEADATIDVTGTGNTATGHSLEIDSYGTIDLAGTLKTDNGAVTFSSNYLNGTTTAAHPAGIIVESTATISSGTAALSLTAAGNTTTDGIITLDGGTLSGGAVTLKSVNNSIVNGTSSSSISGSTSVDLEATSGAIGASGSQILTQTGSLTANAATSVYVSNSTAALTATTASATGTGGIVSVVNTGGGMVATHVTTGAGGNVDLEAAGNLQVQTVNASGTGTVKLVASGDGTGTDALSVTGTNPMVTGGTVNLTADSDIGSTGTPFNITTGTLNAAAGGNAYINQTGSLVIHSLTVGQAATAHLVGDSQLTVDSVAAPDSSSAGGTVYLQGTSLVVGTGSLISVGTLGTISLDATNGGVGLSGSPITISGGTLNVTTADLPLSQAATDIYVKSNGTMTAGTIDSNSGSSSVTLTATGTINGSTNGLVTADIATLQANGGSVGSSATPVKTSVGLLSNASGSSVNNFYVTQTQGDLELGTVSATGTVGINNAGRQVTIDSVGGGTVSLTSGSVVGSTNDVLNAGTLDLDVSGSVGGASGSSLLYTGGTIIGSAGGSIGIAASGSVTLQSLSAGSSISVSSGNSSNNTNITVDGVSIPGVSGQIVLTADGSILQSSTGVLAAHSAQLTATYGGIGSGNAIKTNVAVLSASSGGDTSIDNSADTGSLTIGSIVDTSGVGGITLSSGGSIDGGTLESSSLNLGASGSIGAAGAIPVSATSITAQSVHGGVALNAQGGPIVTLATVVAGGGDVSITAPAELAVTTVSASGNVTLKSSSGSIEATGSNPEISGQILSLQAATDIGASGALPTAATTSLSALAGSGSIYITQDGSFTLSNATVSGANTSINVTDTSGDMTVGTVSASTSPSAPGSVYLTSSQGAILAAGASQISAGQTISLIAKTDVGTVTDFATLTGTPINVSTPNGSLIVKETDGTGQINLNISGAPTIAQGGIKLGSGSGASGIVVLQSLADLNASNLVAGAISIGQQNTASVGLSSAGTLTLPASEVVTDYAPQNLYVSGVSVVGPGGVTDFSFSADELSFHSLTPDVLTTLNTTVSRLDASVGSGSTLVVSQAGNLVLGSILAPGGSVSITGGALTNDGVSTDRVLANSVTLYASSIGASGAGNAVNTSATYVNATAVSGGVYLQQDGAMNLTAQASGALDVQAGSGLLTVDSVTAGGGATLTTTGAIEQGFGTGISSDGLIATAAGIGFPGTPLLTRVSTLNATSSGGGIYVTDSGPLDLTATAGGEAINVQTTSGAMTVAAVSGTGVMLGSGAAMALDGAVNGNGSTVTLAANGAITSNGGSVSASTLIATGTSIGAQNGVLDTSVAQLEGTANGGDIYVTNTGNLNLTASAPSGTVQVTTPNASLTVASVAGSHVNLTTTGSANALIIDGTVSAANSASLQADGAVTPGTGNQVSASDLVLRGSSIGGSGNALNVGSGTVDAATTNGDLYLNSTGTGGLILTAAATNGAVDVQVPGGSMSVTSATGNGVTLVTGGASGALLVNGSVDGHAGDVSLATTGAGSDIDLNGTIKSTSQISVAATGNVVEGAGDSLSAPALQLSGSSIGGSAAPINTGASTVDATSSGGGIFIDDTAGVTLTANATGGFLDVQAGGPLTVSSASGDGVTLLATSSNIDVNGSLSGGTGPVSLTAGAAGGTITLDGVLSTSGDVTLVAGTSAAPGAISTGAGGQIMGAALTATGSALGTAANPLNIAVGELTSTSSNGGTYVNDSEGVALSSTVTGGALDVQTGSGSITVDGASANGVTLVAGGAGSGISVNGAVNAGTGAVALTAGATASPGAILEGSGGKVTGSSLTATAASVGTAAAPLETNISSITADATQGGIYIANQNGLTLASIQSAGDASLSASSGNLSVESVNVGGAASLTASNGTITDGTNSVPLKAKSLTLLARSIGAPSTVTTTGVDFSTRLNIDSGTLNATSTSGGIYINALGSGGLSSVTLNASGGSSGNIELLAPTGSLYLQSVSASNTLLLAAGLNIYGLTGLGTITAQSAELRAGGFDPSTGHIGSPTDPLRLQLAAGNTLRIFVPQTVDYHDPARAPATLPSSGVVTTLSLYAAPSDLAVEAGFGQFQGLTDSLYTSPAESLVHSIQNQTTVLQNVVGLDWSSFDPNISLFSTRDPSVCLPSDQRDEESGPAGC